MSAVQRSGALRVACFYRTVSESAVLVIAGIIPIDLLAQERKLIYKRKGQVDTVQTHKKARARTMAQWQERWTSDTKGSWTARLIKQLAEWTDRKHDEINIS